MTRHPHPHRLRRLAGALLGLLIVMGGLGWCGVVWLREAGVDVFEDRVWEAVR